MILFFSFTTQLQVENCDSSRPNCYGLQWMKMTMINSGLKGFNVRGYDPLSSGAARYRQTFSNTGSILGQCRRRWTSFDTAFVQCLVSIRVHYVGSQHSQLYMISYLMYLNRWGTDLKGLDQAEIIKKSVILFGLLDMTIWCKHVHRLELQKFLNFCAAHSTVKLEI